MTFIFNPLGPPFDITGTTGASGPVDTLTPNDLNAVNPSGNNINVVGTGVSASGISTAGNIFTTGSGSTLTINETQAQFVTNYTATGISYAALPTDYFIACTAAGITITLPSAPTAGRIFVVKDASGGATASPITITAGGVVLINGATTVSIDTNYESSNFLFNGTKYLSF